MKNQTKEEQLTKEFYDIQKKDMSDEAMQQELRKILIKLTEETGKTYYYGPTSKKGNRYGLTVLAASVSCDLDSVEF